MRTFICCVAAVATLAVTLPAAAAPQKRSYAGTETSADRWQGRRPPVSSYGRVPSTMDGIRANAADPTGEFRNYPDWARAAFRERRRS